MKPNYKAGPYLSLNQSVINVTIFFLLVYLLVTICGVTGKFSWPNTFTLLHFATSTMTPWILKIMKIDNWYYLPFNN